MHSSRLPWVFAVLSALILLGSGCGSALRCPGRGGVAWLELTSPHFVLATDRTPQEAATSLRLFETAYQVLEQLAFESPTHRLPPQIHIALFRKRAEYLELGRPQTAGEFISDVNGMDDEPRIALFGDVYNDTQNVFQHELTHYFIAHSVPNAPLWLHEGMAVFYETLRQQDGVVVFGMPNPRFLTTVLRKRIPLAQLLQADRAAFETDPPRYYGSAWLLVHLLRSGQHRDTASLHSYLTTMANGHSPSYAWNAAFGELGVSRIDTAYRDYLLTTPVHSRTGSFQPTEVAISSSRWMSNSEIHILWAQLRNQHTDQDRRLQQQDLTEALQHDPESPEVRYFMALLARQSDRKQAERLLGEALARRSGDTRYLLALLQLRIDEISAAAPDQRLTLQTECERLIARLKPQTHSATALRLFADYQLALGQVAEGLLLAEQSVATDPRCVQCRVTLATALAGNHQPKESAQQLQIGINLLPHGTPVDLLQQTLQAKLRDGRKTP